VTQNAHQHANCISRYPAIMKTNRLNTQSTIYIYNKLSRINTYLPSQREVKISRLLLVVQKLQLLHLNNKYTRHIELRSVKKQDSHRLL